MSFVAITPDSRLLARTVDNKIIIDEWDSPYQDSLWAAMHGEVDPIVARSAALA